jgi:DNA repair protein RadC
METFKRRKCFSSEQEILDYAIEIAKKRLACDRKSEGFTGPDSIREFLQMEIVRNDPEREKFIVLLLDSQHRLIESVVLFQGTINAAPVYCREVVKLALKCNSNACVVAHNHPSGVPEPSHADERVTARLKKALELIDVALLDHFVVGSSSEKIVSFAERGLL